MHAAFSYKHLNAITVLLTFQEWPLSRSNGKIADRAVQPTLLASLGPRIAEISLLSTHRPFLTFLLSIGAPSVWPTRIFNYDDPANCLGSGLNLAVVKPQRRYRARFYSALQYVLVIGSIVNLFQVAIELGTLTVVSWSCALDYLPLAWAIIPFGIHLVAAVSYHIEVAQTETQIRREMAIENGARSPLIRSMTFLQERANLSWLQKEFALCANQPKGLEAVLKQKKTSQFTVFLNCVASLMAFFHLLFGTMLFSSLIFIAVWDILNSVIWRYLISTVVCRLVLLVELAGLREQNEKENDGVQRRLTGLGERVNGMANRVDTLMNEREVAQGRPKERETQRSFAERSSEKAGGEVQQAKKTKRLSLKRPLDEIRAARESETE